MKAQMIIGAPGMGFILVGNALGYEPIQDENMRRRLAT
jgi:hypothetical protein